MIKKICFCTLLIVSMNSQAYDMSQCFFNEKPQAEKYGFKLVFKNKEQAQKFSKELEAKEVKSEIKDLEVLVSHPTREESSQDCLMAIKSKGLKKITKTFENKHK